MLQHIVETRPRYSDKPEDTMESAGTKLKQVKGTSRNYVLKLLQINLMTNESNSCKQLLIFKRESKLCFIKDDYEISSSKYMITCE